MNKTEIAWGFLIGIIASALGSFLYITMILHFDFLSALPILKSEGKLGKIITLGSILDLIAFGILIKTNRELMARGVILAVIVLTLITLFV